MKRVLLVFLGGGVLVSSCTGYIEAPPGWGEAGSSSAAGQGSGGGSAVGAGGGASNPRVEGGASNAYCDVLELLQARCANCHSRPPIRGVPIALIDAGDLATEAPDYPGERAVDVSIARMRSTGQPMPPAPAVAASEEEIAKLETWLLAGMPTECESELGPAAGATGSPYETPLVCTSKTTWHGGNEESPKMRPGGACISCHQSGSEEDEGEGPRFSFGGTIYPTAHEPDDCNGIDGLKEDAKVVIVAADGATFTMSVNSVGNFYLKERDDVTLPYRAKVVAGGRERVMATEQTSGDCNSCHTESGTDDAPGRIMAP